MKQDLREREREKERERGENMGSDNVVEEGFLMLCLPLPLLVLDKDSPLFFFGPNALAMHNFGVQSETVAKAKMPKSRITRGTKCIARQYRLKKTKRKPQM